MEKIYANSEEKYLKAVVLYAIQATGGNTIGLFYDAEGTKQAHNSDYDWKELFFKGLIRVSMLGDGSPLNINNFYVPYRLIVNSKGVSLEFGSNSDQTAFFFADEENEDGEEAVHHGSGK